MNNYIKNKLFLLTFSILTVSCSSKGSENVNYNFDGRWVSQENSKYQIWFQNWSDYKRLFMSISDDTLKVMPNKYAVLTKGKEYLFPKEYTQILKKQLIGNINWEKTPVWEKNKTNTFKWMVDRANPKINLPVEYQCEATFEDFENLNLKVFNDSEIIFDIKLKHMHVY